MNMGWTLAARQGARLLGNQLPAANPFVNINNQPWSQPGVMRNFSGSVRFEQALTEGWSWTAQLASQRLQADDRLAYPYGCYDAGSDTYYADRYCPNGDYDLYDFRSEGERRGEGRLDRLESDIIKRCAQYRYRVQA